MVFNGFDYISFIKFDGFFEVIEKYGNPRWRTNMAAAQNEKVIPTSYDVINSFPPPQARERKKCLGEKGDCWISITSFYLLELLAFQAAHFIGKEKNRLHFVLCSFLFTIFFLNFIFSINPLQSGWEGGGGDSARGETLDVNNFLK